MSRGAKVVPARYRWAVASRVAAAALGGYALTSAATVLLALIWPLPKVEAILAASMVSFAVYTGVVLWAFHAPRLWRLWGVIGGMTLLLSALSWMLGAGGPA